MNLDFNFYPERHLGELDGLLDLEVPAGCSVGEFIRRLHDARCMLLTELLHTDDDGNVRWW